MPLNSLSQPDSTINSVPSIQISQNTTDTPDKENNEEIDIQNEIRVIIKNQMVS